MFEILPNPSLETILIVVRAVLLIGAFWIFALAFSRWRRADERDAQMLRAQLERAFVEMRSLHETMSVMSARIETLAERSEADSRLPPVAVAGAQRGYDLAARLARNGSSVEELIQSCGITRHEAELLTRLHGGGRKREAAPAIRQTRSAPAPAEKQAPTPPTSTGRKRGSLLSVVG
jgi:hypothetical protein